jgi:DNA repair protein RecN (Recombination protein N)
MREELLDDPDFLTIWQERCVTMDASIARLNGRSVNVGLLAEVGEYLVDVHGQSEHLSLMRVRQHLGFWIPMQVLKQN